MQPLLSNSAFSTTPWLSVLANQYLDILDAQAPPLKILIQISKPRRAGGDYFLKCHVASNALHIVAVSAYLLNMWIQSI